MKLHTVMLTDRNFVIANGSASRLASELSQGLRLDKRGRPLGVYTDLGLDSRHEFYVSVQDCEVEDEPADD